MRIDICISTLWGEILSLTVHPGTLVGDLKDQCIAARPSPQLPVNVDLAKIMMEDMEIPNYHYGDGVRLVSSWADRLLDDDRPIESLDDLDSFQFGQDEECEVFLVKMVFMKAGRYMSGIEQKWAGLFQEGLRQVVYFGAVSHQQWIVKGLVGPGDRGECNGVAYFHKASQDHCEMAGRGVDPRIESKPLPPHTKRSRSCELPKRSPSME